MLLRLYLLTQANGVCKCALSGPLSQIVLTLLFGRLTRTEGTRFLILVRDQEPVEAGTAVATPILRP